MDVRTYRAASIQEALRLVWQDLGPEAAVIHTREVRRGLVGWLRGGRRIEVTASLDVHVPSRLPPLDSSDSSSFTSREPVYPAHDPVLPTHAPAPPTPAHASLSGDPAENDFAGWELDRLDTGPPPSFSDQPQAVFQAFAELIDAELSEETARGLIDQLRAALPQEPLDDLETLRAELLRLVERRIRTGGPIRVTPGHRRVVALVGPTGVGKTTTIAKLAANFHLRDRHRVGLITVDTFRIAAVEQLRTYADIIDLPMEVVSTPREMRRAVDRFAELDLVLIDTAGRSPRDEVRIQELKCMLAEARADEVHLVLSSVASQPGLERAAERFARAGTTSLLLTKLDEATGLGNLLCLLDSCRLPLSYITHGQSVPDDISAASPRQLARWILGRGNPRER